MMEVVTLLLFGIGLGVSLLVLAGGCAAAMAWWLDRPDE